MIPFKYILITRTNFEYFFRIVKFAYHKMKDEKILGVSIKLRKKEIVEDGWGILEF